MTRAELPSKPKNLSRREFLRRAAAVTAGAAILPEANQFKIFAPSIGAPEQEPQQYHAVREVIANSFGRLTGLKAENIHIDPSCQELRHPENITGLAHTYEMMAKGWRSFRNAYPEYKDHGRLEALIFHQINSISVKVDDTLDVAGNISTQTLYDGTVNLEIKLRSDAPQHVGPHEAGHSTRKFFDRHPVLSQQLPIWNEFQAMYFSLISLFTSTEADTRLNYSPNREEIVAYLAFLSREHNFPIEPGRMTIGTNITGKQAISTILPYLRKYDSSSWLIKNLPYSYASTLLRYSILRDMLHFDPKRETIENIMIGYFAWAATLLDANFSPKTEHQCFTRAHEDVVSLGHLLDQTSKVPENVKFFSYIASSYLGPILVQFDDGWMDGQVLSHITFQIIEGNPTLRPQFGVPELARINEFWVDESGNTQNMEVEQTKPHPDPEGGYFQQLTVSVKRDPANSGALFTLTFNQNAEFRFGQARYFPPDQKGYPVPPHSASAQTLAEMDGLSIEILLEKMGMQPDEIRRGMANPTYEKVGERGLIY